MRSRSLLRVGSQVVCAPARSATTAVDVDPEWSTARPYSEIPGPKPLPIPKFGNIWRMLPPFGEMAGMSLNEMQQSLYKNYGPIVKFGGVGRPDMIMIYDADGIEKLFRNESVWPSRPGSDTFDYYRRILRKDIYGGNPGVLSSQGEEWQKNRTLVNQPMMRPQNVMSYHQPIQQVASEFLSKMKSSRDEKLELPKDFANELNKWALESISLVALDSRLGCFDQNLKQDSIGQIMIDSVEAVFILIYKLDVLPSFWRYYSTPDWKKFVKVMDNITNISSKLINNKIEEIKNRAADDPNGRSILEVLLTGAGGKPVAVAMAIDMMTAGVDTTSSSSAIVLYYLAKHPEAQEKVFQELRKVMPNLNDDLPVDYSNAIPYLKACMKECQRITPLVSGNARRLPKDTVLLGYQVPKGTDIGTSNIVLSYLEKYFPRPEEFIPERWLKSEKDSPLSASQTNPFAFLPFGFGPRMCIGRRFAELEMHTLLAKIVRNFKVSYNYGEMEWKSEILLQPNKPLQFKLDDRTS